MYQIIDNVNSVVITADKHEIDTAWDVLTKSDDELVKLYPDQAYLSAIVVKYRKPVAEPIRLVQIWKTYSQPVKD